MPNIYITEQDALLKTQNQNFQVFHQQAQCISVPIRHVNQIIIFGNLHLPRDVMKTMRLHHIPVLYLTQQGEYLGRLENTSQLQPKYLAYQRKRSRDVEFTRATAESIIWAKLHNQHLFLQTWTRYQKHHASQMALNYLSLLMDDLPMAKSLNELREYDEEANNLYYPAFSNLLNFHHGCSRTTKNLINTLLNLGYQLLHQHIYTLLHTSKLHPDCAIFHHQSHHEFPLACDLMAEFRAPIVDDLVMNFVKNRFLADANGTTSNNGNGINSWRTLLKTFLQHWEAKLRTVVLHPSAGEVTYRQCMELQIREYLACVLGEIEYYRPLALKFHPVHPDFTNTVEPQKVPLGLVKQ
ncbi:CRISPR-associated endonuclease Cas1 [Tolypothrix campylonemoides VB511288]|nr:CRISPR-associated endonuclease Cas1 [Tolypothrix campylonemoides VB511288]